MLLFLPASALTSSLQTGYAAARAKGGGRDLSPFACLHGTLSPPPLSQQCCSPQSVLAEG